MISYCGFIFALSPTWPGGDLEYGFGFEYIPECNEFDISITVRLFMPWKLL